MNFLKDLFGKDKKKGPRTVNYLWVLCGVYLLYLCGELAISVYKGEATNTVISIIAAVLFAVTGLYLCLREWKIYRYGAPEDAEYSETEEDPEDEC